jgi:hypothetical protein
MTPHAIEITLRHAAEILDSAMHASCETTRCQLVSVAERMVVDVVDSLRRVRESEAAKGKG